MIACKWGGGGGLWEGQPNRRAASRGPQANWLAFSKGIAASFFLFFPFLSILLFLFHGEQEEAGQLAGLM